MTICNMGIELGSMITLFGTAARDVVVSTTNRNFPGRMTHHSGGTAGASAHVHRSRIYPRTYPLYCRN